MGIGYSDFTNAFRGPRHTPAKHDRFCFHLETSRRSQRCADNGTDGVATPEPLSKPVHQGGVSTNCTHSNQGRDPCDVAKVKRCSKVNYRVV